MSFKLELEEVAEVVSAIFHSVLLHRTYSKLSHIADDPKQSFFVGVLGFVDVDCTTFDFTYVRVASDAICAKVQNAVSSLVSGLSDSVEGNSKSAGTAGRASDPVSGTIWLDFATMGKKWPSLLSDHPVWERWTIQVTLTKFDIAKDRQEHKRALVEEMTDHVFGICEHANSSRTYQPRTKGVNFGTVYDLSHSNVTPFHFFIRQKINNDPVPGAVSVGNAVKKILKDTLAM